VGVIEGKDGNILLTRRPEHVHQGGKWEFPGGKVESGETVQQALSRELREELDIIPEKLSPLIRIPFRYPDKHVLLDVWLVHQFTGTPAALEGQPMTWCQRDALGELEFPEANRPIIQALNLPDRVVITPSRLSETELLQGLMHSLDPRSPALVYLRNVSVTSEVVDMIHAAGCLAVSRPDDLNAELDGYHLTSDVLMNLSERPDTDGKLLSASCHSVEQIVKANSLNLDFIFLSPVKQTSTHPDVAPLGWAMFSEWVDLAGMPVYALGGMQEDDISEVKSRGGQGISAITALWTTE
ncbi:MAG: Nudix family hydrolase, partial [Gammaproteobacteria bacterium]|nr:Nudix family hydrolase [Gammaproteobacteria bacterium]